MFFWLSSLMAGLCFCSLFFVVFGPLQKKVPERPAGLRLPALWRLFWPWVSAMAIVAGPFVSWRLRRTIECRLQVAGFDASLSPAHVVGMQLVVFLLVAGLGFAWIWLSEISGPAVWLALVGASVLAAMWPRYWIRDCGRQRQLHMLREFPFFLDMTTLCVEAGLNLQGALQQAARHGPDGPLLHELRHALADMRAGVPRIQALEQLASRTGLPALQHLVTSLGQADQLGMSLGPLLRAQSEQRRSERFLRAEKLALEAPVKMLFPMVFCIFPCTFLIIGFPIAVRLFDTVM